VCVCVYNMGDYIRCVNVEAAHFKGLSIMF
jgi:hypothetical protein